MLALPEGERVTLGLALALPLVLGQGVEEGEEWEEALAAGCVGVACWLVLRVGGAVAVAEALAECPPPLGVTVPLAVGPPSPPPPGVAVGEGPVGAALADTEREAVEVTLGEAEIEALPVG